MAHPMKAQTPAGAASGETAPAQVPRIPLAGAWETVFQGEAKTALEALLPAYLQQWRWFGGKARQIRATVLTEAVRFPYDASVAYWAFVAVEYEEGEPETYVLPLTVAVGPRAAAVQQRAPQAVIARVQRPEAEGLLCEAWWEPPLWAAVLTAIAHSQAVPGRAGALSALPTQVFADLRGPADAPRPPPCWPPSRATPRSSTAIGSSSSSFGAWRTA